jgi:hypothetical protein
MNRESTAREERITNNRTEMKDGSENNANGVPNLFQMSGRRQTLARRARKINTRHSPIRPSAVRQ